MDKITSECPHLVDLRTENKELLTAVDNWKHAYFSIWESTSLRRRCECTKLRERVKELESADPYCPVVLIKTNEELKQRVKELEQDAVSYRSNLREAFRMGQDQTKEIQRLRQRKEEEEGRNIALRQRVKERDSELMKAYSERTKLAERMKERDADVKRLATGCHNLRHERDTLQFQLGACTSRISQLKDQRIIWTDRAIKRAERIKELEEERDTLLEERNRAEKAVVGWKQAYEDLEKVRKCARARVNELENYIERLTKERDQAKIELYYELDTIRRLRRDQAKIDLTSAHR